LEKNKIPWNKGKTNIYSEETLKKISSSLKGNKNSLGYKHSEESKKKMSIYAKNRTKEHLEKISNAAKNRSTETRKKMSDAQKGKISPNWKGGYFKNNIASFEYHGKLLESFHEVRRNKEKLDVLETKCTYCGKWYTPTWIEINNRIKKVNDNGGSNLYCSNECKNECPTYNQQKYPKGFKLATSREIQPELRKLVFERDNWLCVKCNSTSNIQCHHIDPVVNDPLESADLDNCITLCKNCHKEVHKKEGCRYNELRC